MNILLKEKDQALFKSIYDEFEGIQYNRLLKILNNEYMSNKDLKAFYSNLLIKIKLDLKEYLRIYEILIDKKRSMKRELKKYKSSGINIGFLNAKYLDSFVKINRDLNSLNKIISQISTVLLKTIEIVCTLGIFDARDISSIFSIPINMVQNRIIENDCLNKDVILDLIIKDYAEFYHSKKLQESTTCIAPFHWALNSAYLFTIDKVNVF